MPQQQPSLKDFTVLFSDLYFPCVLLFIYKATAELNVFLFAALKRRALSGADSVKLLVPLMSLWESSTAWFYYNLSPEKGQYSITLTTQTYY